MKGESNILGAALRKGLKTGPANTVWVTVKSVDWDKKVMDVVSVMDGLEYFDVVLGLGSYLPKPKVGTKCIIGILEGNEAATFLIHADEVDQVNLNGEELGGLVDAKELKKQVDKNTEALDKVINLLTTWVPAPQDGGLKLSIDAKAKLIGLQLADLSKIENKVIKHGNG
jgi:hypothetical protein